MNNKAQTGRNGEVAAADYLINKGFTILERNYRYKRSEIDIIAVKEKLLIFVEVKTKRSNAFGFPEDAVNSNKIEKVMEGADQYIHESNWPHNIRFDVIAINQPGKKIFHFEDAFH